MVVLDFLSELGQVFNEEGPLQRDEHHVETLWRLLAQEI